MSDSSDQIDLVNEAVNSQYMPPPPPLPDLNDNEKEEHDQQANTNTANATATVTTTSENKQMSTTNDQNFWQNIVEQIYTSENHVITSELLNSILTYVDIW